MGSAPLALSVHHFITSVGSDAGFAAIIGLAILVLLYFAQARETATLRDHAYEAAQRIQQLEGQLAQQTRQAAAQPQMAAGQAQPAPVKPPALAAAIAHGARPAAAAIPAAPAGVAAPALSAATKLIPTPAPQPQPAMAPAVAATPSASAATQAPSDLTIASPPPATAAGGANGASHDRVPPPAAAPSLAPPPRVQIRPTPSPAARRPLTTPGRGAPGRAAPRGPRRGAGEPRGRMRQLLPILLAVLVLGGAVAGLLIATSGGSTKAAGNSTPTTNVPGPQRAKHAAAFNPSSVTVAVLNGTATSGLAHRVALHLAAAGYKQGTVATAADQTRTATVVAFMPGRRNDALHVASALKLGTGAVQPIDSSTQAVACPPPTPCAAQVVVTVGSDLSTSY